MRRGLLGERGWWDEVSPVRRTGLVELIGVCIHRAGRASVWYSGGHDHVPTAPRARSVAEAERRPGAVRRLGTRPPPPLPVAFVRGATMEA
jgi:hypothetical protein